MMRQLFDLRLLPAEGEAEVHDELAALARFAFKGDGAAHQVYDILGDGKAETRALNAADSGAFLVHKVRQMHRLFLDLHLAALDAAHIQHIVDEGEQVLAGDRDLFQVVQHLFLIINMGRRQRGEADDGVHRGADVVAHVEQELPLGTVCRCLVPDGKLQLAVLLLQLGVVFLLLLPLLLFRKLHGAMAQRLQHCHKDQIKDQRSQQYGVPRCGAAGGNIHRRAVCQQNALEVGLLRILQHVPCGILLQRLRKLHIACITICIFTQ